MQLIRVKVKINREVSVKSPRILLGLTGAPGTGKTTLAEWLVRKLTDDSIDHQVLPELARILKEQGVMIDKDMHRQDYDAFLEAYDKRDTDIQSLLALADRTPIDHCSYLMVNQNMDSDFIESHIDRSLKMMDRYRLIFYLPVQFPIKDDGFRETSIDYQQQLDQAITSILRRSNTEVIELYGDKRKRRKTAFAAIQGLLRESSHSLISAHGH